MYTKALNLLFSLTFSVLGISENKIVTVSNQRAVGIIHN